MLCSPSRLAVLALLLTACERGPSAPVDSAGPRWVPLTRGFEPRPLLALVQGWQRAAGLDATNCKANGDSVEVEVALPNSAWSAGERQGLWTAAVPGGAFAYGTPGFLRLTAGGRLLAPAVPGRELAPGQYRALGERVELCLPVDKVPADDLRVGQRMESGRKTSDGVWQVRIANEFDAGFCVWSGLDEGFTLDASAPSRLSFVPRYLTRSANQPVELCVRLDGEVVWQLASDSARLSASGTWQSIELPRSPRKDARLTFEVRGPPGQALFLHPVLGPAQLGSYGARPWFRSSSPDIVLFLADTFRADNLACYGGEPELAPHLNAFAESALRFTNARANAAWTLPSISTLLTGLTPGQHTANEAVNSLPGELITVVESLSRAGYRTGAVTDAAFFTPMHGLDQGFESFVQNQPPSWNLGHTLRQARAFLEQDDGRPVFLLVHTYRAHLPYRSGPEEDRKSWNELVADNCALLKSKKTLPPAEWKQRLAACAPRYRELYHAGVRELDRGFGEFLDALGGFGLTRDTAFVLFTSDHGEALGENDDIFHGGDLWESKLRVPLLLRGPALAPRTVTESATLLDVAPTLAALAGLTPDPRWSGASLLTLSGERPALAFRLQKTTQLSLVEGGKKLFTREREAFSAGAYDSAFDLATDPHEERPIRDAPWAAELARRQAELLRGLLDPSASAIQVPISPEQQQELDALGYGGDKDD
ncbi:MAG: hypothetical protein EXS08_01840 [Planctomycetes bacterium]|nr:hypothetical protein [Planctomycetota bacterium]